MNRATILPTAQIDWVTHPGARGKRNDDAAEYFWVRTALFLALADGVTSTDNGDQASQLAIAALKEYLSQDEHQQPLPQRLDKAVAQANFAIWRQAQANAAQRNMSTTLVLAAIDGDRLYVAHVGDSRAYLIRNGEIHRLTLDHTWVQEALDVGRLTEQSARRHLNRHVIQRYLGIGQQVEVDHAIIAPGTYGNPPQERKRVRSLKLRAGDVVLLCSDGLTESVSDAEIKAEVLRLPGQPKLAAEALIELALERNEGDNITVMVLAFPAPQPLVAPAQPVVELPITLATEKTGSSTIWVSRAVAIAALCLLLIVLVSGLGDWQQQIGLPVSSAAPILATATLGAQAGVALPIATAPPPAPSPTRPAVAPTDAVAVAPRSITPESTAAIIEPLPTPTTTSASRVPTNELPTATPTATPTQVATRTPTPLPTQPAVPVRAVNLLPSEDLVIQERRILSFQLEPVVYGSDRFLLVGWEGQEAGLDQFHCLQPAAGSLLPLSNAFALQPPNVVIEIPLSAADLRRIGIKEKTRYCWGVAAVTGPLALLSSPRDDLKLRIEPERSQEPGGNDGGVQPPSPTVPAPRNEEPTPDS